MTNGGKGAFTDAGESTEKNTGYSKIGKAGGRYYSLYIFLTFESLCDKKYKAPSSHPHPPPTSFWSGTSFLQSKVFNIALLAALLPLGIKQKHKGVNDLLSSIL